MLYYDSIYDFYHFGNMDKTKIIIGNVYFLELVHIIIYFFMLKIYP